MKLKFDVWRSWLHVSTKFRNVEKSLADNFKNPKRAKISAKIPKIRFLQKTELMVNSVQRATYVPDLEDLFWFMRQWVQKWVRPTFD